MSFDPTAPGDSSQISAFPANERALRLFLQTYMQLEHNDAAGEHEFRTGTDVERDTITWPTTADKMYLWGKDDTPDTLLEIQYKLAGGAWQGIYEEIFARHNAWTQGQVGQWQDLTPGPTVNMDFGSGNFFRMAITQDVVIANPTLPTRPALLPGACYFLELEQGDGGNRDISSFGSNFVFSGGLPPSGLTDGLGNIDLLQMIIRFDGSIHLEMLRDSQ